MTFKNLLSVLSAFVLIAATAVFANESQTVGEGEGQYNVIAGYSSEPPYTGERNGLDSSCAPQTGSR